MHAITYVLECPKMKGQLLLVDMASVMSVSATKLPGEILPAVEVPYVDNDSIPRKFFCSPVIVCVVHLIGI
jgi:hypothetical protein